jgi:hypothetical protein
MPREAQRNSIFLKITFDKVHERIEWSFITQTLQCLWFGAHCVDMVNSLFFTCFSIFFLKMTFFDRIILHKSIRQGCPLAP